MTEKRQRSPVYLAFLESKYQNDHLCHKQWQRQRPQSGSCLYQSGIVCGKKNPVSSRITPDGQQARVAQDTFPLAKNILQLHFTQSLAFPTSDLWILSYVPSETDENRLEMEIFLVLVSQHILRSDSIFSAALVGSVSFRRDLISLCKCFKRNFFVAPISQWDVLFQDLDVFSSLERTACRICFSLSGFQIGEKVNIGVVKLCSVLNTFLECPCFLECSVWFSQLRIFGQQRCSNVFCQLEFFPLQKILISPLTFCFWTVSNQAVVNAKTQYQSRKQHQFM